MFQALPHLVYYCLVLLFPQMLLMFAKACKTRSNKTTESKTPAKNGATKIIWNKLILDIPGNPGQTDRSGGSQTGKGNANKMFVLFASLLPVGYHPDPESPRIIPRFLKPLLHQVCFVSCQIMVLPWIFEKSPGLTL